MLSLGYSEAPVRRTRSPWSTPALSHISVVGGFSPYLRTSGSVVPCQDRTLKDFHRFGAPKRFFHVATGPLKEISNLLGLLCHALPSWCEKTEALVPAPSRLGD